MRFSFSPGSFTCAAHVFKQEDARGTVFLVHGYYDHTGILKNLITASRPFPIESERASIVKFNLPSGKKVQPAKMKYSYI